MMAAPMAAPMMAKAGREPWQAAAPRRSRRSRPKVREAEATREADADVAGVLRRLRDAGFPPWQDILQTCLPPGPPQHFRVGIASFGSPEGDAMIRPHFFLHREDLLLSDFWSTALETINSCLSKHLEQLSTHMVPLSEALGNLSLNTTSDSLPETYPAHRPLKCVCYGLGNFSTCVIARHQLAFLRLFLEKYQIPPSHCYVYDPLFSPCEIEALQSLGLTVLSENEEGKRSVSGELTLFYMPHCGTALYNNLLWRNWSSDALCQMLIIGNSFRGLEDRLLTRVLQKNYPYIAKILKGLEELAFPETSQYSDTFNDTSIHWFPVSKIRQLPTDTWTYREEPDYGDCEDLEIIRKKPSGPLAPSANPL